MPNETWYAAKHALKFLQRLAESHSGFTDEEFPDRILVRPGSFLDHGNGATHVARRLEIPQHDDRVREIADINGMVHVADHAMQIFAIDREFLLVLLKRMQKETDPAIRHRLRPVALQLAEVWLIWYAGLARAISAACGFSALTLRRVQTV